MPPLPGTASDSLVQRVLPSSRSSTICWLSDEVASTMAARMLFVCVKAEIILLLKHRGTKLVREAFSCSRHGGVGRRRFDLVEGRKRGQK